MNEIKRIHLGRQPFEIAVDAHKLLQEYLHDITVAVGGTHKEVLKEVELRMAELLTEKGITSEKTILASDVEYLKQQLGEPGDFQTDEEVAANPPSSTENTDAPKRLFRDTQNGVLAGVSAGLAAYFGLPVILVRLIFIALTVLWGWGALLYIILWLVVPEVKTSSERLQMQGKPVTVDSLKELVNDADVEGAAKRASGFIEPVFRFIGHLVLVCIGVSFVLLGVLGLTTAVVGAGYVMLYHDNLFLFSEFVLSARDLLFGGSVLTASLLMSLATILAGIAIVRRKWTVPSWVSAAALAALFVSGVIACTLAPGVVDKVQRYADGLKHEQTAHVEPYQNLRIVSRQDGASMAINYEYVADARTTADYRIVYNYIGDAPIAKIKKTVQGGTLSITADNAYNDPRCKGLCLVDSHDIRLTIHGPALQAITMEGKGAHLGISDGLAQPSLQVSVERSNEVDILQTIVDKMDVTARDGAGAATMQLTGLSRSSSISGPLSLSDDYILIPLIKEVSLHTDRVCGLQASGVANPVINFDNMPERGITINDTHVATATELKQRQADASRTNPLQCVVLNEFAEVQ